MMLDSIKQYIYKNVGKPHKFLYKGARNQEERFDGVIVNTYPRIFTVLLLNNQLKSFSYSDILISNLKIY